MSNPTTLRAIKLRSDLPFSCNPIQDITMRLPRAVQGWEKALIRRKDNVLRSGLRAFEDITKITIHHDAVEGGTPEGHARYHLGKGDYGIAYHLFIKVNQIYQVNDLLSLTWHTPNNNFDTIGICLAGNFMNRNVTDTERQTLYAAILTVKSIFPNINEIKGHKEFNLPAGHETACPGVNMMMPRVRSDILNLENEIEYRESALHQQERMIQVMTRTQDLFNKAKDPKHKYNAQAIDKMMKLYGLMKDNDLMNPVDMKPLS